MITTSTGTRLFFGLNDKNQTVVKEYDNGTVTDTDITVEEYYEIKKQNN